MKKFLKKLGAAALTACMALSMLAGALALRSTISKDVVYNDYSVTLNGAKVNLKDSSGNATEPFIIDDTTYLPLRAISELLNLTVEWDGRAIEPTAVRLLRHSDGRVIKEHLYFRDETIPAKTTFSLAFDCGTCGDFWLYDWGAILL